MEKPLAKVKAGDLLSAQMMNAIIDRINDLEKRLDRMERKTPKRATLKLNALKGKAVKKKTPKKKVLNVKTFKRKILRGKNPKRKTTKRKSS